MPKFAAYAKIAAVAAAVAIVAALASAPDAHAGKTMDRIVSEKLIRLGVRTDAPPFASVNGGRLSGFSVDLCGLIAGAILETSNLGALDGKFMPVQTDERFEALQSGKIDVLCGATTATLKRREIVSFSIPTFSTGVGALVSASAPDLLKEVLILGGPASNSEAAVTEALRGQTIGFRSGTTAADWLSNGPIAGIEGVTLQAFDDHAAGVAAVADGSAAAYFSDKAILLGVIRGMDNADGLLVSRANFTREPYALALPRDDEDLRLAIDRALSHLYRNGQIFKVYERHFGKPSPEAVLFYNLVAMPE